MRATTHHPETQSNDCSTSSFPSRRALMTAGAWAVPAVVLATSTPALAASPQAVLTLSIPPTFEVGASIAVVATLVSQHGHPVVGEALTVSATAVTAVPAGQGMTFSAGGMTGPQYSGATDGAGRLTLSAGATTAGTYVVTVRAGNLVATAQTQALAPQPTGAAEGLWTIKAADAGATIVHRDFEGRPITQYSFGERFTRLQLSADRRTFYAVRSPSESTSIYHIDAATMRVTNVVSGGSIIQNAEAFSLLNDGRLLVSTFGSKNFYAVDPNTGASSVIGQTPDFLEKFPASSVQLPDGRILSVQQKEGGASRVFIGTAPVGSLSGGAPVVNVIAGRVLVAAWPGPFELQVFGDSVSSVMLKMAGSSLEYRFSGWTG